MMTMSNLLFALGRRRRGLIDDPLLQSIPQPAAAAAAAVPRRRLRLSSHQILNFKPFLGDNFSAINEVACVRKMR